MLGFLFHHFSQADHGCLSYLYKTMVRPILEYCPCVWDPHQSKYTSSVMQSFVQLTLPLRGGMMTRHCCTRIFAGQYYLSAASTSNCPCAIEWCVNPQMVFTPHLSPMVRHMNSCQPYHRVPFFVSAIQPWNALPDTIVSYLVQ